MGSFIVPLFESSSIPKKQMAEAGPTVLNGSIGKPTFMHTSIMLDMLLSYS